MKCPICKTEIEQLSKSCALCGYVYTDEVHKRLTCVFDLKRELNSAVERLNNVQSVLQRLSTRMKSFEELLNDDLIILSRMVAQSAKTASSPVQPSEPKKKTVETPQEPPTQAASTQQKKEPFRQRVGLKTPDIDFELKVGQRWLLVIGIVTIVFGVAYFLKYSFDRGWVGPAGRVALSYIWAISFLIGGEYFRKKGLEIFGLYVIGGGIAVLYFSTFAGFSIYHLFGQFFAFFVMILITAFATVSSLRYDSKWMAVLGLIGGFLTPMLLSTGTDNQIALMAYMTILNLALLWVAFYKKWDLLNYLGFVFTYVLFTAWVAEHYRVYKFWPTILFLNTFYAIYNVVPFAYQFLRTKAGKLRAFFIISPNSFIAFAFS